MFPFVPKSYAGGYADFVRRRSRMGMSGGAMRLRRYLDTRGMPPYVVLLAGLASTGMVGLLDFFTGYELGFSLFYVLPLVFVTWFSGRTRGLAIALVSAGAWLTADVAAGNPYSSSLVPVWNVCIRLGFFLIIMFLVAALRAAVQRAEELSHIDSLTGAVNSRFFYILADGELDRLRRYGHSLTAAYLDLDDFKAVNDTQGHLAGDAALRAVVDCARAQLRKTDVVARLGGDEFAFLCPETDEQAARAMVAKVQDGLREEMRLKGWPITFSIGALTCLEAPDSSERLVKMVDDLMYSVKVGSKNGVSHSTFGGRSPETALCTGGVPADRQATSSPV
jgi:diguanylate cyclase (GGDEF)-like protein